MTPTENADFFKNSRPPSVLWTAQGQFLVANSEASTINRNTGVFWALLQCRYSSRLVHGGHMTPTGGGAEPSASPPHRDHLFVFMEAPSCSPMIHLPRS